MASGPRKHWNPQERLTIIAAGAGYYKAALAAGATPDDAVVEAINKAQAEHLPLERRRKMNVISHTPSDVVLGILNLVAQPAAHVEDPRIRKLTDDLDAAEALLVESTEAMTTYRATVQKLEADVAALRARPGPMQMIMDALADVGVVIARRVIQELRAQGNGAAGDPVVQHAPATGAVSGSADPLAGILKPRPEAKAPAPAKPRILVVAGSEHPTRYDERWMNAFPDVTIRIERARADGRLNVPRGYDAAVLVSGVRHATSNEVRAEYPGARMAARVEIQDVLKETIERVRRGTH